MDKELGKFVKYLISHFHSDFTREAKKYIEQNESLYVEKCKYITTASEVELEELDYQFAWVHIKKGVVLYVDLNTNAIATVHDGGGRGYDEETIYHWITFRFTINIRKNEIIDEIQTLTFDKHNKRNGIELDDDMLVPKIFDDNYEKVANIILSRTNNESIQNIGKVDVDLMCKRLGLNKIERRIDENNKIFGQICFVANDSRLYDFDKEEWLDEHIENNTIIVNKEIGFLYSFGTPNLTIAHECAHYYLHKAAFFFARKYNKAFIKIQCQVEGQESVVNSSLPLDVLEIQANKLAPLLLMPKIQFTKKAKDVMLMYNQLYGGNLIDSYEEVIDELSNYYGVTKYAVRRRLVDIGYDYMLGTYNWVDGHYVQPFAYDKGSLKNGETYTISKMNYFSLLSDSKIGLLILSGNLVLVDNHLVINDTKVVNKNPNGRLYLTQEARNHLNKYAIKFKIQTQNAIDSEDRLGTMCYLCKGTNYEYNLQVIYEDPTNCEIEGSQLRKFLVDRQSYLQEYEPIKYLQPKDSLKKLMDDKGINQTDLATASHLSSKTIGRYLKGETKPPKKEAVMLCLALAFPPEVLMFFIESCGHTFKLGDLQDQAYQAFISGYNQYIIEECNNDLIEAKLEKFY